MSMKKVELLQKLDEIGIEYDKDLRYNDLYKLYKEYEDPAFGFIKPTVEQIDEIVEYKLEAKPDLRSELDKTRERIMPAIVKLMNELRGQISASQDQLNQMFRLYNQYYMRNDDPGCSSCVARVYEKLKRTVGMR